MNTGNYIFDYIYDLVEIQYITKDEAMMFTEGFHKKSNEQRIENPQIAA